MAEQNLTVLSGVEFESFPPQLHRQCKCVAVDTRGNAKDTLASSNHLFLAVDTEPMALLFKRI